MRRSAILQRLQKETKARASFFFRHSKSAKNLALKPLDDHGERVAVTAVWGVTFVQVKDAVAVYPLFAFLAVRFGISTVVLAPFACRPLAVGLQQAGHSVTLATSREFSPTTIPS